MESGGHEREKFEITNYRHDAILKSSKGPLVSPQIRRRHHDEVCKTGNLLVPFFHLSYVRP